MEPWWLDAHLDLAFLHLLGPSIIAPVADPAQRGVSLPALRAGRVRVALGTIFTELGAPPDQPWGYPSSDDRQAAHEAGTRQLRVYQDLEAAGQIRIVRTQADLRASAEGGPVGIVLLMEGADPIRTPDEAAWWHAQGLRVVGLCWARGSRYAGGNSDGGPLTAEGRAMVQALDAAGVLHDASHLSDAAFDGVMAATSKRVVASHSNARALMNPSQRHLTDAQISALAARGGVIGLNLFGKFLAEGRAATLEDAVRHVQHVSGLAGRHAVGLGSDFDGGFGPGDCPHGCQRPEELGALDQALAAAGWSSAERQGFAHGNWMQVLMETLPARMA